MGEIPGQKYESEQAPSYVELRIAGRRIGTFIILAFRILVDGETSGHRNGEFEAFPIVSFQCRSFAAGSRNKFLMSY